MHQTGGGQRINLLNKYIIIFIMVHPSSARRDETKRNAFGASATNYTRGAGERERARGDSLTAYFFCIKTFLMMIYK